jgi:predicted ATPase
MLTRVEASEPPDDNPASGREAREVNTWRDDRGRMLARACVSGVLCWIDWVRVGRFSFSPPSRTVTIQRAAGASDAVVADIFHRQVQPLVLQALGFQVLHASAALVDDAVVVLAGFAHSGKSTLAHAMGRAGYVQFADDAVVMEIQEQRVAAHGLSFSSRLRHPSREYFESPEDTESARAASSVGAVRPVGAIVLLSQSASAAARPQLRRLPAAEALRLTMLHANGFDATSPDERRRTLGDYLEIAQAVPVFDLPYRPVFGELAGLVRTVVEAVSTTEVAGARR